VDSYCQEITADDIKLLEDMITARNDDPDIYKVQPLGKEDLMDEQREGSKLSDGSASSSSGSGKKKEVSEKIMRELDMNHHMNGGGSPADDTPSLGPIAQRLLAGLVDEKVLLDNSENKGALGVSRPGMLRSLGLGSGVGLEKRLKKELQEQGIMEPDHPGQVRAS